MPRNSRLMDYLARRDMARNGRDMRNPYGSKGGYVDSTNNRGVDYGRDYNSYSGQYHMARGDRGYSQQDSARYRRDYESSGQSDMDRRDYADMRDMHRMGRSESYRPIEAMGYFSGYYGGGQDMARGGRRDYDYDYDMDYDYARRGGRRDYDYAGDYGENLTHEELEHWRKKLEKEVTDEQSKQFFKKERVEQKAKQLGIEMKHFNADELAIAGLMLYSDYSKTLKPYIGQNMDIYLLLARDFMDDKDSEVKGGEKLAIYKMIVSGEED